MNKLLLAGLFVLASVGLGQAWDKDTYSQYILTASSAQVFSGGGYLKGIALSSTTDSHSYGSTYVVGYDTVTIAGAGVAAITSGNEIMFPRLFTSTPTANIDMGIGQVYWYPEPGLFVANGLWVYKNVATSGGANKAILYIKR
jgi:hypothetical protein